MIAPSNVKVPGIPENVGRGRLKEWPCWLWTVASPAVEVRENTRLESQIVFAIHVQGFKVQELSIQAS